MEWIYMAYILPSKQFDGCKDAKGLNLDQFQNDSWLYGKTFITISKLRLHFYKQIDIQSNHTHYSHSFDEIIEAFMGVKEHDLWEGDSNVHIALGCLLDYWWQ